MQLHLRYQLKRGGINWVTTEHLWLVVSSEVLKTKRDIRHLKTNAQHVGHCRRRKIRCIAAPGDPHNRCSNCIRLKKECNFFPVEQQPPPESQQRKGSMAPSGIETEESSPTASSGQVPSEMSQTLPYPHLSMPPIQDLGGPQMKRQRTDSFSPETKGKDIPSSSSANFPNSPAVITTTRNFEYPQPPPPHGTTNWMAPEASPSTANPKTEAAQPYWRVNPQDSPITPAFSPFTPGLQMPPSQNWPPPHEASPREDPGWSVPQRSSSYSNFEGLHNQEPNPQYAQYPPPPPIHDQYSKPPGMQPPMLKTSLGGFASHAPHETSNMPHHPHSAHSLPPVPVAHWQGPYSSEKAASAGTEQYTGWSGPHGGQQQQLPQPQQNQNNPPLPPGMVYHNAYGYYPPPHGR